MSFKKFSIHCKKYFQNSWDYCFGNADSICLNIVFSLPSIICNNLVMISINEKAYAKRHPDSRGSVIDIMFCY